jgi:hypothetical protein
VIFDDYAIRVAAIGGDASKVPIGGVVGEGHIWAELLKANLAIGAGTVGVNHAAYGGDIARLELGYCGANFGDSAYDLMAGDAGIYGAGPLVTDCMKVRMADTTEQDFDLNIVFARIASRDHSRSKG